jgi:hypothetical protein
MSERWSPTKARSRNIQITRARARKRNLDLLKEHGSLTLRVVVLGPVFDAGDGTDAHAVVGVMTLCGRSAPYKLEATAGLEVNCQMCQEIIDVVCEAYE